MTNKEKLGILRYILGPEGKTDWMYDKQNDVFVVFPDDPEEELRYTEYWTDGEYILFRDIWNEGHTLTGVASVGCL